MNEKRKHMIYLKINNNKGHYRVDDSENWIELDKLGKEHLLKLLDFAVTTEFEMEEYDESLLSNPAHNIIYKNLYVKFRDLLTNKTRFQDTAEAMYKAASEKYKIEDKA